MSLFSWLRKRPASPEASDDVAASQPAVDDAAHEALDDEPTTSGPWDVADEPELGARIDLGAIRLPARPGMRLRMEADKTTREVVAASLTLGGSVLQLQAFAAPRRDGVWAELREEIAASVTKQGGSADEAQGPFGPELLARLPVRTKEGRSGHRPARFLGVDGPRWFLRGVLTGQAAISPQDAAALEEVFRDAVVVRGSDARPPREPLTLTVPRAAQQGDEPAAAGDQPAVTDEQDPQRPPQGAQPPAAGTDPLTRGPEITETR